MSLWLLCLLIQSIEADHSLTPADISCKRREYQLITDRSHYFPTFDNPLTTIRVGIGYDDQNISPLLTELWYEEIDQQSVTLRSSNELFQADGEFHSDQNHSWTFHFSSMSNQSDFSFYSKSILTIQSTTFQKPIDLLFRINEKDRCSSSNFAVCCNLCVSVDTCPEIEILSEHSRYDIIVTNRGLMVPRSLKFSRGDLICILFPSEQINRFWSTITHGMNVEQIADKNDLAIVQHSYGIMANFFHYSQYPFHHWTKQIMHFQFLDVLFISHKQWAIFQLNECQNTLCKVFLRIYIYKLNKTMELNDQLQPLERIVETNVSSTTYFRLYFHMLSNIFYLIGEERIYASKNYGETFLRIWTGDFSSNNSLILDPIVFAKTGHIAFIYQLNNASSCCEYFAVFSKTGLYFSWRTRVFRSSILLPRPFFFDSTGSFYFNTTPPLLVIIATDRSLVATPNVLINEIPGRYFVRETDLNRFFVFCSLSVWDHRFELTGSTIRFEKLGRFFVISMNPVAIPFAFCLQTSRLDDHTLQTSRECLLTLHASLVTRKIHLQLSGCVFNIEDEYSTMIIPDFPNIFIEQIVNETFALGRIFQETKTIDRQVKQWNMINIRNGEQILDRCLLKTIDENPDRPSFISLRPTTVYPLATTDQLVTKHFQFLIQNNYERNIDLIASSFDNRKSIIHQEFLPSQLSCYMPVSRTITFLTKCLANARIRSEFQINSDRAKLTPIELPINFQLNRYEAGFQSVIVYNLASDKKSICDGLRNCSCVSSLVPQHSVYCAEQIYAIDSTVDNRVYMKLWMEKEELYLLTNKSVFLMEEVSKRNDYQLIDNPWTNEMKKQTIDLFLKNFDQLTENEQRVFHLLSREENVFLGPNLNLKLLDEGLYHFRLTYLWGDEFCFTSSDFLILMISNTGTLSSYLFNYFLACILIFIFMVILWIIYVIVVTKVSRNFFHLKNERFFTRRSINENVNFEVLVKIREQFHRLLPSRHLIVRTDETNISTGQVLLRQHVKQLVNQLQRDV